MTIPQPTLDTPVDPAADSALALAALGWIVGEPDRADRLLALTGLTPDMLRARLGERGVQAAVLEFLLNHEPDLVRAAEALGVAPGALVAAQARLAQ